MPVTIESTEANNGAISDDASTYAPIFTQAGQAASGTDTTWGNVLGGAGKGAAAGSAGGWIGAAGGAIVGGVVGAFQPTTDSKNAKQLKQQSALNAQQLEYNETLTDYNSQSQYNMWKNTNQVALAEYAGTQGFNPALIYGGGGGGGATVNTANNSAPQAPNEAEQTNAESSRRNSETGQITAAEQIKAQEAAIKQTNANTDNIKANTELTQFQNVLNNAFGMQNAQNKATINGVDAEKTNLQWEAFKTAASTGVDANGFPTASMSDINNPYVKALKAGFKEAEAQLKNEQENNELLRAKTTVEQFKANLAKEGIDPDSPWYVNIIADLLSNFGITPTSMSKGAVKATTNGETKGNMATKFEKNQY